MSRLLSQKQFETRCPSELDIVIHATVDSTNSWLLQQVKAGSALPRACFAEQQTQGRGRRGKQWLMPPYSNIAMSLAWRFSGGDLQLHLLPVAIALAIVDTLEFVGVRQVQIKWPNDVYVHGQKIAGILIETVARGGDLVVVIGVGLNYDMSGAMSSSGLQDLPAFTDVCSEVTTAVGRDVLAAELLARVIEACEVFSQQAYAGLERFSRDYDFCRDKTVEIQSDNNKTVCGIARGVNHLGELVVEIDGGLQTFNSAQVSVKPRPSPEYDP